MSTSAMYMEGTSPDGGKTIVFNSTMDEPVMGVKDKPVRFVSKWVDENTRVLEAGTKSARRTNSKRWKLPTRANKLSLKTQYST
ncbi:MAG: DUF1579 family protein [bacterium]|nr:DUF1579 family protein [bacterium]